MPLFECGLFNKQDTTGNQAVSHGLGETPKALIVFFAKAFVEDSWGDDIEQYIGFTDGTSEGGAGIFADDAADPTDTTRRVSNELISTPGPSQSLTNIATFVSWNSSTFTINWSTNDGTIRPMGYILFGGADVSAKVLTFQMPTVTGTDAVTGVGFKPDFVMFLNGGGVVTTFPKTEFNANFNIGMMELQGNQLSLSMWDADNAATTDASVWAVGDKAIIQTGASQAEGLNAAFSSMDADGFTLNWIAAPGSANYVVALCLKGFNVKIGSFAKSTNTSVPVSQAVTGVGFAPKMLWLLSPNRAASANALAHLGLLMGAHDGTNKGYMGIWADDNAAAENAAGITGNDDFFRLDPDRDKTTEAAAELTSFDADGFTLSWVSNETTAAQIFYIAFGNLDVDINESLDMADAIETWDNPFLADESMAITESLEHLVAFELNESMNAADTLVNHIFFNIDESMVMLDSVADRYYLDESLDLGDSLSLDLTSIAEESFDMTETLEIAFHDYIDETFDMTDTLGVKELIDETFDMTESIIVKINSDTTIETLDMTERVEVTTYGASGAINPDVLFHADDHDEFFVSENPDQVP